MPQVPPEVKPPEATPPELRPARPATPATPATPPGPRRHPPGSRRRRPHGATLGAAVLVAAAMVAATVLAVLTPASADTGANPFDFDGRTGTMPAAPAAWKPQARGPFPGGPHNKLNQVLSQGEAASRALPGEHPRVLFVGDSITQWWRTNGRLSWRHWFAPLGAADDGVVADTTSNVLARLDAGQYPRTSPRVVVLMIGTNNIPLGQSPPDITRGILAVVADLHVRMPASHILVLGLLPRGRPGSADRRATIAVNRLLRSQIGDQGSTTYLDVGPLLLGAGGRFLPGVMLPALLHPSERGYARISGPVYRAILAAS